MKCRKGTDRVSDNTNGIADDQVMEHRGDAGSSKDELDLADTSKVVVYVVVARLGTGRGGAECVGIWIIIGLTWDKRHNAGKVALYDVGTGGSKGGREDGGSVGSRRPVEMEIEGRYAGREV